MLAYYTDRGLTRTRAKKVIDQYIRLTAAHPNPTGWRDIATAPKDGSVVHVAWSPDDWTIGSAFYTDGKWVASAIFYCLNS
ncbi:hypothetical protein CEY04_27740, partial [Achromobacter sp. HZ28]